MTGYFIDKSKKCCPTYLSNCSVCSLSDTCSQCYDGYYTSEAGSCALCSSVIPNCYRCANSTFCYQCQTNYTTENFTKCQLTSSSSSNLTTNNSTNNNTDPDNNKPTQTPSGLSLWLILFIAIAEGNF